MSDGLSNKYESYSNVYSNLADVIRKIVDAGEVTQEDKDAINGVGGIGGLIERKDSALLGLQDEISRVRLAYTDDKIDFLNNKIDELTEKLHVTSENLHITSADLLVANEVIAAKVSTDYLEANYADIEKLEAEYATIKSLEAERAEIDELLADKVTTEQLNAKYADIESLVADKATVGQLNAEKARIDELEADYADIDNLKADKATVELLEAKYAEIDDLYVKNAEIDELLADKVTTEQLNAKYADIEDLVAENIETTTAQIGTLEAGLITANELIAKKANIEDLTATNLNVSNIQTDLITTKNLVANKANISDLNAANANIGTLQADVARINELSANHATITQLEAVEADVEILNSTVGDIDTLINGNLTSDNIKAFNLTAGKVTVDDAFIKDAMIDSVTASKLTAGTIDTNNITIKSTDGSMIMTGSIQQFKDENGKVRIQIGKDTGGNFTFILYNENGTGVLIDESGIKSSDAIADGLIVDSKVSNKANISGSKLDIASVITEVNNDNSTTIKSNKIYLDEQGQSLEVAFNSLKTQVETIQDVTIDGDLSSVIEQVQSNTTQIQANKEGISTLVAQDTIINETISNLDGEITEVNNTLTGKYTSLEQNLNGFKTTVADTYAKQSTVNDLDNNLKNNYSTTSAMNSAINQKATEITTSVGNTYATKQSVTDLNTNLTTNYSTTSAMNSAINQKANEITSTVSETYATKESVDSVDGKFDKYSTTTQMNSAIEQKASGILSTVSGTYQTKDAMKDYSTTTQMNSAIDQSASNITSTVSNTYATKNELGDEVSTLTSSISTVEQKADRINWVVKSDSTESNMQLTDNAYSVISNNINLTASHINLHGYVTANQGFSIDTSGNMTANNGKFTGAISGSTISGGSINIGNGNFVVDENGNVTSKSANIDGYLTMEETNSAISTSASGVLSTVSNTYQTKDAMSNYSTTTQMNSAISQSASNITSTVSNTYATKNDLSGQVSTLTSSISTVDQKADKISWLVKSGTSSSDMVLTDKLYSLTTEKAMISAKQIELNGSININNGTFKVDTKGNMTAKSGTFSGNIEGATIKIGPVDSNNDGTTDYYSFAVASSGNLKIGGNTGSYCGTGFEKAQFEVTSTGTMYSVSKDYDNLWTKISEGSIYLYDAGMTTTIKGGDIDCSIIDTSQITSPSVYTTYVCGEGNTLSLTDDNCCTVELYTYQDSGYFRPSVLTEDEPKTMLGSYNQNWNKAYIDDVSNIAGSDRRIKTNISYYADDDRYEKMFMDLKPCTFQKINNEFGRQHSGFISQDVEEAMLNNGLEYEEFSALVKTPVDETGEELNYNNEEEMARFVDYQYGLRYGEFTALNTHMIQKAFHKIEEQDRVIAELKAEIEELKK